MNSKKFFELTIDCAFALKWHYHSFGMIMPGKSVTPPSNYRYGFNGQEKDDEIKGSGNSYTAAFWEYDPCLGRRWNIDPVEKIGMSAYMCFSGNPISRTDINGDDDVFDRNGNWLFSTKKGTLIKVVTPKGIQSFSEFTSNEANSKSSSKIVDYYKEDAGFKKGDNVGVDPNSSNKTNVAYTVKSGSFISAKEGAHEILNDFNNLISVLNHENIHKINGNVISFQDHLDVYTSQMDNEATFKPTSNEFKLGTAGSYAEYLLGGLNANEIDPTNVSKKIDAFNEKYAKYNISIEIKSYDASSNTMELIARGLNNKGEPSHAEIVPRKDAH